VERVHEIGDHLRVCQTELVQHNVDAALAAAEAGLHRWTVRPGAST
jgi:hypothetical protein